MNKPAMIYGVTFHVNPKKRVHTFWFTDKEGALAFYESVKRHPNVLDHSMFQIPANEVAEYDGDVEEGRIIPVEP